MLSEASKRAGVERTHEREDVARLVPAPAREVLAPADQVTHLDFEGPFLAEAVGTEAVAVDEGVVLPELGDKLLQVGDRLCVVDLAAEARYIGPTGRLAAVDGDRVDGLLAAAVGRERRKWSARESRTLVCAGEQARRTPASKLFILGGVCGLPWPCATICRAPRGRERLATGLRDACVEICRVESRPVGALTAPGPPTPAEVHTCVQSGTLWLYSHSSGNILLATASGGDRVIFKIDASCS